MSKDTAILNAHRHGAVAILLLVLALAVPLVDVAQAVCPAGDLDGDCEVTIEDLRLLAEQWLAPPGGVADLNGDDRVNWIDLAVLAQGWYEAGIPLVINEILTSNASVGRDPQGEYEDWIEIHNYGEQAIDVGGMYLTDDLGEPTLWRIPDDDPAATTIPAKGYLLIWADNDVSDAGLHASFQSL